MGLESGKWCCMLFLFPFIIIFRLALTFISLACSIHSFSDNALDYVVGVSISQPLLWSQWFLIQLFGFLLSVTWEPFYFVSAPIIWPFMLLFYVVFAPGWSSFTRSKNCNAHQHLISRNVRRKFRPSSSKSTCWYNSNPRMASLAGSCGIFYDRGFLGPSISCTSLPFGASNNVYCLYSWWTAFLLAVHVQQGDIWLQSIILDVSWAVGRLYTVPYVFITCKPRKPPNGPILHLVMFFGISLIYGFFVSVAIYRILALRFGLISPPKS